MQTTYKQKRRKISDLKLEENPVLDAIVNMNIDAYASLIRKYNDYYELPVVTPEGVVLSHMEDIEAAIINGVEEIDVIEVSGLTEAIDLLRFTLKSIYFKELHGPKIPRKIYLSVPIGGTVARFCYIKFAYRKIHTE